EPRGSGRRRHYHHYRKRGQTTSQENDEAGEKYARRRPAGRGAHGWRTCPRDRVRLGKGRALGPPDTLRPEDAPMSEPRPTGVLLVEDQRNVREALALLLEREGFAVWPATGGAEALELLRAHAGEVGVALVDVQMPGLDG